MQTAADILSQNGIRLDNFTPGKHRTTCPHCSGRRKASHRTLKCLGIKIDERGVCWHCNHCGWSGPEKGSSGNGSAGNPATTYDYYDAHGVLQFQKVRAYDKAGEKFFWIRRPNRAGGWINGAGKANTKILYRLPELIEAIASERVVAVVEGEKDTDRLRSIGIPATCNAQGASEPGMAPKWTKAHSEQLRGADIVVLNDNDEPGLAYANAIVKSLAGIAKRVRRLDLALHWSDMPPKADVSDWLATGRTREELDALIERAPECGQPEDKAPPGRVPGIIQVAEWVESFANISADPLIEDHINGGEIIGRAQAGFLYGESGLLKTAIKNEINLAIATGTGLGRLLLSDQPVYKALAKGWVLSAIHEDPIDYQHRLKALAKARGFELKDLPWAIISNDLNIFIKKERQELVERIERFAELNGPPVLIDIDTVAAAAGGESLNDDDVIGNALELAKEAKERWRASTLFIAHPNKKEKQLTGSYRQFGNADFVLRAKMRAKNDFMLIKEKDRKGASQRPLFAYTGEFPQVGETSGGRPITGAFIGSITPILQDSATRQEAMKGRPKLTPAAELAHRALQEAVDEVGTAAPPSNHIPQGVKVVTADQWREYAYKRSVSPTDTPEARKKAFQRASESLQAARLVAAWGDNVWLTERDK
jgi:5S rRNA maturation endonuclease (ribonuclease M5)